MVSFVGTQSSFSAALKSLIELEYDALEAYEAAINRIERQDFKTQLLEFKDDHKRHIEDLSNLLSKHGETPPKGPDNTKQWITKGKVLLANIIGDKSVLSAMYSNELDTNAAYERMRLHDNIWKEARELMDSCLADERRHKAWLEEHS